MNIIDIGLKFIKTPDKRKITEAIILHHSDALSQTVETIHNYHINSCGYCGIGYNFYIRKDGSIYLGRGWDAVGAHAGVNSGYNSKSIGICFEGKYNDSDHVMPEPQYNAGVLLIREAIAKYGNLSILGHCDVTATACPGKYFPFDKMRNEAFAVSEPEVKNEPSDWAKEAWGRAHVYGILDGSNPQGYVTREMMAVVLDRVGLLK